MALRSAGSLLTGGWCRDGNVAAMEIREVAVVGLGTMGAGIAEVFARAGIRVVAIEADPQALRQGLGTLDASLSRAVSRGRLAAGDQADIRARVRPAAAFSEAAAVDLAIEAVPERMEIKRQVFAELDRVCGPQAILATNTSSLSVTSMAACTKHPGRVVGMHFFNPAPVMRLVEVVSTVLSDESVPAAVAGLARRLGKVPVPVGDRAGFVANALLMPYLNHAVELFETGYASAADIDKAATAGIGLPMGPLGLLDLIGLDTSLSILEVMHAEFGQPRYCPTPLLRRLVAAGWTGRKASRGIYTYADGRVVGGDADAAEAAGAAVPDTVTLIGRGDEQEADFASVLASAGLSLTRNPAHPSDLVVVVAAEGQPVLPAALAAGRAGQAVGVHFPGGVHDGSLAELIRTSLTTDAAMAAGHALAGKLGVSVVQAPDRPGFLVGALLYPHLADAVRMAQHGYAGAADIDAAMTLGCGYPRGPFQLIDAIGAADVLAGLRAMYIAYGYPGFAPPPLLAEHAAAGIDFAAVGRAAAS
jgi:3-hydroxybutyryl-CoA dehydrogenase